MMQCTLRLAARAVALAGACAWLALPPAAAAGLSDQGARLRAQVRAEGMVYGLAVACRLDGADRERLHAAHKAAALRRARTALPAYSAADFERDYDRGVEAGIYGAAGWVGGTVRIPDCRGVARRVALVRQVARPGQRLQPLPP